MATRTVRERIAKSSIPDVKDGDIVVAERYNRDNEVVRAGINANFEDILGIREGKTSAIVGPDGSIKFLKLGADNELMFSVDGVDFFAVASSGHLIVNQFGTTLPQTSRIQYMNTDVSVDGNTTIVSGLQGPAGPQGQTGPQGVQGPQGLQGDTGPQGVDGRSFTISGRFDTVELLQIAFPSGPSTEHPDRNAYFVGPVNQNNPVYVWNFEAFNWEYSGYLQGPAGQQGPQGADGPQGPEGIQGQQGIQGIQGPEGPAGKDGQAGPKGDTGAGVPTGGFTGQFPQKRSDADLDVIWDWVHFSEVKDKPTTVAGFGITDTYTKLETESLVTESIQEEVTNTLSFILPVATFVASDKQAYPYMATYNNSLITGDSTSLGRTVTEAMLADSTLNESYEATYNLIGYAVTSQGSLKVYMKELPTQDLVAYITGGISNG